MNSDTPSHGTQFSNDGAFQMLVVERLARIETVLESISRDRDEMRKDRDDHESRIRGLERWRYMLPASLTGAFVSAGVAIYGQIGR